MCVAKNGKKRHWTEAVNRAVLLATRTGNGAAYAATNMQPEKFQRDRGPVMYRRALPRTTGLENSISKLGSKYSLSDFKQRRFPFRDDG